MRRTVIVLAALTALSAVAACDTGDNPAPGLDHYRTVIAGVTSECQSQSFNRNAPGEWQCDEWRITEANGDTYLSAVAADPGM